MFPHKCTYVAQKTQLQEQGIKTWHMQNSSYIPDKEISN